MSTDNNDGTCVPAGVFARKLAIHERKAAERKREKLNALLSSDGQFRMLYRSAEQIEDIVPERERHVRIDGLDCSDANAVADMLVFTMGMLEEEVTILEAQAARYAASLLASAQQRKQDAAPLVDLLHVYAEREDDRALQAVGNELFLLYALLPSSVAPRDGRVRTLALDGARVAFALHYKCTSFPFSDVLPHVLDVLGEAVRTVCDSS